MTGSFNASAAQWLLGSGLPPHLMSPPRDAARPRRRIEVDQDTDGTIWIGGRTETLFSGRTHF